MLLIGLHALKQEVIDRLLPPGLTVTNTASSTLALAITSGKKLTLTSTGDFNLTIPETGTAALLGTFNIFTARQRINVNSAAALMVEQTGVKDCVLVVDTTNARVGVNCIPTTPFTVGCNSLFTGTIKMNANSTAALLVEQSGTKDNVLVVDTTNARVGVNVAPKFEGLHVGSGGISLTYGATTDYRYRIQPNDTQEKLYISYYTTQWYPDASHPTLTITYDGKIGIKDSAPSEILDINGNANVTGVYKVDDVQVISNRVIDSRIDDTINTSAWDSTTAGVLDAIRDAAIAHGLIAASGHI